MEYLTIGAGPAGLQLAYFLEQTGRDYIILEAGPAPGTFFRSFPRHRTLISSNKPYTGSTDPEFNLGMDWNSLLSSLRDRCEDAWRSAVQLILGVPIWFGTPAGRSFVKIISQRSSLTTLGLYREGNKCRITLLLLVQPKHLPCYAPES